MSTKSTTTTNDIIVMDPPPSSRIASGRSGRWQKRIHQVAETAPNQWVQFAQGVKSPAYFYLLSAKNDHIEVTTRVQEDKTFDVYIKVNV